MSHDPNCDTCSSALAYLDSMLREAVAGGYPQVAMSVEVVGWLIDLARLSVPERKALPMVAPNMPGASA